MLKRSKWRPIAIAVFAVLLLAVAAFFFFLMRLDVLTTDYLLLVIAVAVLFVYIAGVLLFFGMRRKRSPARRVRRIIGIVLSLVLAAAFLFGATVLNKVEQTKRAMIATPEESPRSVVGIYVLPDDAAKSLSDMAGYKFAALPGLGEEKLYANYAIGKVNEALNTKVEAVAYPGIADAFEALKSGDVKALAVSKGFLSLTMDPETEETFGDALRLVDDIVVPRSATLDNTPILVDVENAEPTPVPTPTPEPTPEPIKYGEDRPLIFYLSGMDKYGKEIEYNAHADVNLLMVVNPFTKQILLVSTPRDFFVMNNALGGMDKLTHCAIQGVPNSIRSLNDLYGIQIDNFCRVNFTGFDEFVELIGGITVDNPTAFRTTSDNGGYYFEQGKISLTGYEALCYARERNAFGDGELARGRNQIRVISAMIEKARSNSASILMNYSQILDALAGTFETDLSSEQMSDLIKVALGSLGDWDIKSYSAWGGSGKGKVASMGSQEVYFIWPNERSVAFATELFDTILNNELITDEQLEDAPRAY